MNHRRQRHVAWLALCVMAFAAIAPAATHWLARSTGLGYAELCTVAAIKRIALDQNSAPVPADDPRGTIHCPFCRLQHYAPALPSAHIAFAIQQGVELALPVLDSSAPVTSAIWSTARSRAPPAFS